MTTAAEEGQERASSMQHADMHADAAAAAGSRQVKNPDVRSGNPESCCERAMRASERRRDGGAAAAGRGGTEPGCYGAIPCQCSCPSRTFRYRQPKPRVGARGTRLGTRHRCAADAGAQRWCRCWWTLPIASAGYGPAPVIANPSHSPRAAAGPARVQVSLPVAHEEGTCCTLRVLFRCYRRAHDGWSRP
jgi:hypothetical protein